MVEGLTNFLAHQQQLSSFLEARNASEHLLAIQTRSKPLRFILPSQPALADRPPATTKVSLSEVAPAVLEGIAFAPRYIIGRTRITMVAQVLLAASLSFLTTPHPELLSLRAFSQRVASVVHSTTRQSICCRS